MDDLEFLLCFVILGEVWLFLRGVSESVPFVVLLIYSLPTSFPPSPGANRNTGLGTDSKTNIVSLEALGSAPNSESQLCPLC